MLSTIIGNILFITGTMITIKIITKQETAVLMYVLQINTLSLKYSWVIIVYLVHALWYTKYSQNSTLTTFKA